jgi:hypothetical protein
VEANKAPLSGAVNLRLAAKANLDGFLTLAIVYVGYDCPLCGRWALHILKKTDGKWKQVATRCDAMS